MFRRLANLLMGKPSVTPNEREEAVAYYEKSVRISALQTLEADRYNSAMLIHMNSLDDPESSKALFNASKRLVLIVDRFPHSAPPLSASNLWRSGDSAARYLYGILSRSKRGSLEGAAWSR